MLREDNKQKPSNIMEGFISIKAVIEGKQKYLTTDRDVLCVYYDKDKKKQRYKELKYLENQQSLLGFKMVECTNEDLSEKCISSTHGGIIAECTDRNIPNLLDSTIKTNGFYVLIEGIEDPYNFGYCIRSLFISGCDGIILNPRNWMSASGVVCRASAGTSEISNMYISDTVDAIKYFKQYGYTIASTDFSNKAVSLLDSNLKKPILIIIGGEKRGLTKNALDLSDFTIKIDYARNFASSLSSASSATIIGYEVFRQNRGENGK